jgi:hypothetical protein
MLFGEEYMGEQKVGGLKKIVMRASENSNEPTCCVKDKELNE